MAILLGQRTVICGIFNTVGHLVFLSETYSKFFDLRGSHLKNTLEDLPKANSNSVTIGIAEDFAIIPEKYFLDRALAPYLHEHLGEDYEDNYVYDNLEKPKSRVAYHLDESIKKIATAIYSNAKIINSITASIKLHLEEKNAENALITNLFEDRFEYIGIKENALQMANRYSANTAENYLYFLLLAAKHNGIDTKNVAVQINGESQEIEEIHKIAKQYLTVKDKVDGDNNLPELEKYIVLKAISKCA